MSSKIIEAYNSTDLREFLGLAFPKEWQGLAARIIESGAQFDTEMCAWAPRWSKIPLTVRKGEPWNTTRGSLETAIKSCLYRAHDCIHQLWGLPIPGDNFSEEDFYLYKRAQMCGEVAVLTLTEFALAKHFSEESPAARKFIMKRNALPMMEGPLAGKSILQIALRLDDLLHKKSRPKWVRDMKAATDFVDDYVPMLEFDRVNIDHNWNLMKTNNWYPTGAPNSRYNKNLDGLELTTWMINDFYHQMDTDPVVDEPLRSFNKVRRESIFLPTGWNGANK